jgi:hypothetical protein
LWEVVGLERGSPSLVNTTEELIKRKSRGTGLENRKYGRMDPSRWPRGTPYPQKLALNSTKSDGRPFGIVRSRTQNTEFVLFCSVCLKTMIILECLLSFMTHIQVRQVQSWKPVLVSKRLVSSTRKILDLCIQIGHGLFHLNTHIHIKG